jgi:hypothetical protein
MFGSTFYGVTEIQTKNSYHITKLELTDAGTEYTFNFPAGTKGFQIQNRNDGTLYLHDGPEHWTLSPGQPWFPEGLKASSLFSVSLSSNKPSQVVEVLYWS